MDNPLLKKLVKQEKFHLKQADSIARKIFHLRQKENPLKVSDHALMRYMERCKGFDLDAVRSEIITEDLVRLYNQLGNGQYPTGIGTTRVVIEDGVIVTILT